VIPKKDHTNLCEYDEGNLPDARRREVICK
jgi:hypothetical protein